MAAPILIDAGTRYGRLVVIARRKGNFPGVHFLCRCDCGRERIVAGKSLRDGRTHSCGCYQKDVLRALLTTHGDSKRSGWAPEYQAWVDMRSRCHDAKHQGYRDYGGRGITVCAAWRHSYEAFLADMGRRPSAGHSLDRINNDGSYGPENCRWSTRSEQQRNKRKPRPYVRQRVS